MSFEPVLSVVVPAYNEAAVLDAFFARTSRALDATGLEWEIVFADDGSTDATAEMIRLMHEADPRIALVSLSRNFGKEIAMTAGLDHARGQAVVVIDADLQDPPELIGEFVRLWKLGHDVVYARRTEREGETTLKRATAHLFYRLMNKLAERPIPADVGDFRLMSRRAVDSLLRMRERHRFMKGLYAWVGYSQVEVPYARAPRAAGTTKWNYWRLWNLSVEGFTSFSILPLQFASYFGFLIALLSTGYGFFIALRTIIYGNPVAGYPSLVVIVLFLGGVQLMTLGIIGEYVGRIFNETKNRPLYLSREVMPSAARDSRTEPTSVGVLLEPVRSRLAQE
jgi:glycosyltransferase involved in cell wall biosynthesis